MSTAIFKGTSKAWRWIGTAIAVTVLFVAFRNVSLVQLGALLTRLHTRVLLIPLPFAFAQLTETAAWRSTFRELGCRVRYGALLRVRLACEGLVQTMPGGMLVAESVKPALLVGECGLTPSDAVCGAASRKFLLLVSQCVYFAGAALLGLPALRTLAQNSRIGHWLTSLVLLAWVVLLLAAYGLWAVMSGGNVCRRILLTLKRFPIRAIRCASEKWRHGFLATDARIVEFCALGPRRLARSTVLYLLAWCWEAVETIVILRLLGVQLDWGTLCLIEVCASMIRHVAFVSPAGLGIQDIGYAGLLHVFGVSDWLGVAATFTLLKRGKEICWSFVGYALLAWMHKQVRLRSSTAAASGSLPALSPCCTR